MTKNEAREILAETWRFSRVGDLIALREVELIEAVRDRDLEAARSVGPSSPLSYTRLQLSRSA